MKKLFLICCLFIGIAAASHAQTTSDPAEKAKGLQKQLKLTDAQTAKVATIYAESAKKFEKIKGVLTPAQAVKYDKLVKDTKSTGGNGWSDGWSPASAN